MIASNRAGKVGLQQWFILYLSLPPCLVQQSTMTITYCFNANLLRMIMENSKRNAMETEETSLYFVFSPHNMSHVVIQKNANKNRCFLSLSEINQIPSCMITSLNKLYVWNFYTYIFCQLCANLTPMYLAFFSFPSIPSFHFGLSYTLPNPFPSFGSLTQWQSGRFAQTAPSAGVALTEWCGRTWDLNPNSSPVKNGGKDNPFLLGWKGTLW